MMNFIFSTAHSPFKLVPKIISSCPELMLSPQIVDLLNNSDAIHCVQALVGNTVNRSWGGQQNHPKTAIFFAQTHKSQVK